LFFVSFSLFLFRGNEQVGLALIQTIWLREHNYQARRIFAADNTLSNDEVFLRARRIVIAEIQKVLLDWFSALGIHIPDYPGYTGRDPQSTLEFVSGAMRVGHTQISNDILAVDSHLKPTCGGGVTLANSFFNPQVLFPAGCPEGYIRGLSHSPAQAVDVYQVSDSTTTVGRNIHTRANTHERSSPSSLTCSLSLSSRVLSVFCARTTRFATCCSVPALVWI
jgi:hypothetical protein